jgi:hypothetical protein
MKKSLKKLSLNKETLNNLDLGTVVAGMPVPPTIPNGSACSAVLCSHTFCPPLTA